jgi:transcriptional regulator with XRE-family HTH domain
MSVSQFVRDLRAAQGESQQAFSTRLGISIRALANYESGYREPDGKALAALARSAKQAGREDLEDMFFQMLERSHGIVAARSMTSFQFAISKALIDLSELRNTDTTIEQARVIESKVHQNLMDLYRRLSAINPYTSESVKDDQ